MPSGHLFPIHYEWLPRCSLDSRVENKAMLTTRRLFEKDVVFAISGRIEVEDIAELHRLFGLEGINQHIALDLQDVTLVSRDVVKFLASCEADGIDLGNCPAYVREWIEAERLTKR
jgi:hypothetical protein